MHRRDKAITAVVLGLTLIAGTATSEPLAAVPPATRASATGPVDLELGVLERITGGAYLPEWRRAGRDSFRRGTFISSSISMPIAQAFAVCFMCADDASAVAVANAFGDARADASSFASGFGNAFTRSDAVGQPFVFMLPRDFQPPSGWPGAPPRPDR